LRVSVLVCVLGGRRGLSWRRRRMGREGGSGMIAHQARKARSASIKRGST